MIHRDWCLLCNAPLIPVEATSYQRHPDVQDCLVRITDAWGIAVDASILDQPQELEPSSLQGITLNIYPFVEEALISVFAKFNLPRLGGISTGRGWSSVSNYQRCPYSWKRRYIDRAKPFLAIESPSLAVGTMIHAFLALHYIRMMPESPYVNLTPVMLYDRMVRLARPEYVEEGWRVFKSYELYYRGEIIEPLVVEYDLRDPRTNESCRFDLIAFFPEAHGDRAAGTYDIEHKSAGRFDYDTLTAWAGDGEILGQVMLWQRLGLANRFGPLQGVIVNLLGKQLEPKFHRTIVSPTSLQLVQHANDLKHWEGLVQLSRSNGIYPRARNNCVGRYGRCEQWDHCLGDDL